MIKNNMDIHKQMDEIEYKKVLVSILRYIDDICNKNNIMYFVFYGSLLGAVRHKGIIPWDDDIDIAMLRDDYEKFTRLFNNQEGEKYQLVSIDTKENYYLLTSKIIDTDTVLIENVEAAIEIGAFVDLFVLDRLGSSRIKIKQMAWKIKILYCFVLPKLIADKENRSFIKKIIIKAARRVTNCIDIKKALIKIRRIAMQYNDITDSEYCGAMSSFIYGEKEVFPLQWLAERKRVAFEGIEVWIPAAYDKVLKHFYGNYMQFPPVDERVSHHNFVCYKKPDKN